MDNPELKVTGDGSHTLWLPEMQESYHSLHGALTESQHVFINEGLKHFLATYSPERLSILEVGFGTGLNTLLTLLYGQKHQLGISYTSLEPYPLPQVMVNRLNYPGCIDQPGAKQAFKKIHTVSWGESHQLGPRFSLMKLPESIQEHQPKSGGYDLVYFDAFAPQKQPEIWDLKVLQAVKNIMGSPAVLVTYCAQGQFRRNLAMLGFEVLSVPGPPGKKEMTRASVVSAS